MPEKKPDFFKKAKDLYGSASEKIVETKEKARETIEEHPFASVVVAAAVGAVVGILTNEIIKALRKKDNL